MVLYLGVGKHVGDVCGSRQMWSDVIWCYSGECKRFEEREWILQGKPISVVKEYTYLGVKITPDLNELKMMEARIGKMEMILGSQKRFLCNYRIPAQLRVKVLESVVLTSGLYGGEVWVFVETRTTHRRYKRCYAKV